MAAKLRGSLSFSPLLGPLVFARVGLYDLDGTGPQSRPTVQFADGAGYLDHLAHIDPGSPRNVDADGTLGSSVQRQGESFETLTNDRIAPGPP